MNRVRPGRNDLPLNADINVTSLVDVAFTLLVIFIITAPVLQGGIEVAVPTADVAPLNTPDRPLIISVQRGGQIFVEETPYDLDQFRAAFPQLVAAGDIQVAYIRADSLAPYARVLQVMGVVNGAGIIPSLVAEPM
jgi:biopolymer transport protein ExbD